ncbi:hypothetical protein CPC16_010183, partial [Podila verticillata]
VEAIGVAKSTNTHRPPSLNGSFEAFFTNKARSFGYLVVGINEYYSSKRCPVCKNFVAQTTDWRTLYCHTCKRFRQRDVMASDNMNNAIKGIWRTRRDHFISNPNAKTDHTHGRSKLRGSEHGNFFRNHRAGEARKRCSGSTHAKKTLPFLYYSVESRALGVTS